MQLVTKDTETQISPILERISKDRMNYYAILFRLSELDAKNKTDYKINIVLNILNDFFKTNDGFLFLFKDKDVLTVFREEDTQRIQKVIFQLRHLLAEDPLAFIKEGVENNRFTSVYILQFQWAEFSNFYLSKVQNKPANLFSSSPQKRSALDLSTLLNIEEKLSSLSIAHLMRSQSICTALKSQAEVKSLYHELYVSIGHLKELLNFELVSNQSLFKYLTQLLDKAVLSTLTKRVDKYSNIGPISLNLNISSIGTQPFTEFINAAKIIPNFSMIVELDIADVFSDIHGFIKAKEYLKQLNFRICLDGVNNISLIQIDRESLGFDLVKLQWSGDKVDDLQRPLGQKISTSIQKCGANRIILSRCDNINALHYGHALGMSLFQGWYFDKILNPYSNVKN
jgi:hypothetical protein